MMTAARCSMRRSSSLRLFALPCPVSVTFCPRASNCNCGCGTHLVSLCINQLLPSVFETCFRSVRTGKRRWISLVYHRAVPRRTINAVVAVAPTRRIDSHLNHQSISFPSALYHSLTHFIKPPALSPLNVDFPPFVFFRTCRESTDFLPQ